jgi:two-component system chemotaxis response regulator CheB
VSQQVEMSGSGPFECPECSGVVSLRFEAGKHHRFRCQVGHVFAVDDLIAAKEERLEARLWTALRSLHELAHLLDGVAREAGDTGLRDVERRLVERAARARQHADLLRRVLDEGATVDTSGVAEIQTPWTGR